MPLTYAYRKHPVTGTVQHVLCDLTDLPRLRNEGWHDSPSKVPGTPGYVDPEAVAAAEEFEHTFSARTDARRGPGRPRKVE